MSKFRIFIASLAASALALALGGLGLYAWGMDPPGWLVRAQAASFSTLALAYGFSSLRFRLAPWTGLRSIRGATCVVTGVAVMYIPPQFLLSAYLMGAGIRSIWAAACELGTPPPGGGDIGGRNPGIVPTDGADKHLPTSI